METPEQRVKYVYKVNKIVDVVLVKRRQNHITEVVVVFLMLTWTDNSNFSGDSIVDFEQVITELNSANHNIQTFWYFFLRGFTSLETMKDSWFALSKNFKNTNRVYPKQQS